MTAPKSQCVVTHACRTDENQATLQFIGCYILFYTNQYQKKSCSVTLSYCEENLAQLHLEL